MLGRIDGAAVHDRRAWEIEIRGSKIQNLAIRVIRVSPLRCFQRFFKLPLDFPWAHAVISCVTHPPLMRRIPTNTERLLSIWESCGRFVMSQRPTIPTFAAETTREMYVDANNPGSGVT